MSRSLRIAATVLLVLATLVSGSASSVAAESGPDVAASITSDGLVGKYGEKMTFVVTATNLGDAAATDVTISGWVPDWFNYFSHTCGNGTASDWGPSCDVGVLEPGKSATLTLVVAVAVPPIKGDKHVFELGWTTASNDVNPDNDQAEVRVITSSYCHKGNCYDK